MKNLTLHQGTLDTTTQATCHHLRIIQDFLVILMDFLCKPTTCVRLVNTVKLFIKIIAPACQQRTSGCGSVQENSQQRRHSNRFMLLLYCFKVLYQKSS